MVTEVCNLRGKSVWLGLEEFIWEVMRGQSCLMSLYQGQYIQGKTVPRILTSFSLFMLDNTQFIYSDDMYTVNNCIRGSHARLVAQSPAL